MMEIIDAEIFIGIVEGRVQRNSVTITFNGLFRHAKLVIDHANSNERLNVTRFEFGHSLVLLQRATMLLHGAAQHTPRKVHPDRIRPKALGGLQILLRSCEVLCRVGIVKLVDFSFDYASRRERRARIELGGLLKPAQRFVQVKQCTEVVARIAFGLAQQIRVDQIKDNLAEVVGQIDSPHLEHDAGHPAVIRRRQVARAAHQLGAGNMLGARLTLQLRLRLFPPEQLLRVLQRGEDELVCLISIALIAASHLH